jgi:hypothetical protein
MEVNYRLPISYVDLCWNLGWSLDRFLLRAQSMSGFGESLDLDQPAVANIM